MATEYGTIDRMRDRPGDFKSKNRATGPPPRCRRWNREGETSCVPVLTRVSVLTRFDSTPLGRYLGRLGRLEFLEFSYVTGSISHI